MICQLKHLEKRIGEKMKKNSFWRETVSSFFNIGVFVGVIIVLFAAWVSTHDIDGIIMRLFGFLLMCLVYGVGLLFVVSFAGMILEAVIHLENMEKNIERMVALLEERDKRSSINNGN